MLPESPCYRSGKPPARSGVSAANIRFYEKSGLLQAGARRDNSYRSYDDRDVHQLRFIRLCRAMDMSLDEVRTLLELDLSRKADCASGQCRAGVAHRPCARAAARTARAGNATWSDLRDALRRQRTECRIIEALHERADRVARPMPASRAHRHV